MGDKSINEPRGPIEVRFSWLEEQVVDIKCNVNLLMAAIRNKLGIFGEEVVLNVEDKSEWGSRDRDIGKTQTTN